MASAAEVRSALQSADSDIDTARNLLHQVKSLVDSATVQVQMVREGSVDPIGYPNLVTLTRLLDEAEAEAALYKEASSQYQSKL